MQVCGAGRGAVAATAMPHVRRRARRPREARRRRGAPARARARAGRAGPSCARAGAGRGAAAAPARPRRATAIDEHHARAGQRAAPRSESARGPGVGRRHQVARLQTADAGKCKSFWCRRQDAMWPGVLRHQIQFWDPSPFGVEGGFSGAGRTAAEGWARARPEWGIHRAPRRAEPKSMNSSQAELRRRDGVEIDRQVSLAGPSVARSTPDKGDLEVSTKSE